MKAYFRCVHSNFRLIWARNSLVFLSVIIAHVEQYFSFGNIWKHLSFASTCFLHYSLLFFPFPYFFSQWVETYAQVQHCREYFHIAGLINQVSFETPLHMNEGRKKQSFPFLWKTHRCLKEKREALKKLWNSPHWNQCLHWLSFF